MVGEGVVAGHPHVVVPRNVIGHQPQRGRRHRWRPGQVTLHLEPVPHRREPGGPRQRDGAGHVVGHPHLEPAGPAGVVLGVQHRAARELPTEQRLPDAAAPELRVHRTPEPHVVHVAGLRCAGHYPVGGQPRALEQRERVGLGFHRGVVELMDEVVGVEVLAGAVDRLDRREQLHARRDVVTAQWPPGELGHPPDATDASAAGTAS